MSKGVKPSDLIRAAIEEKVKYYLDTHAWTAKNRPDPEGILKLFYEWGFTDAISWFLDNQAQLMASSVEGGQK